MRDNIILIGMPGAGKSTVGVLLAKDLGLAFLDTDIEIQNREGRLLQEIVDEVGPVRLREIESEVCQALDCRHTVIATGGSAVYSPEAMAHLASLGTVVWLEAPYEAIAGRVALNPDRGIAKRPDQTLEDVFNERQPLYERYAQVRVSAHDQPVDAVVVAIREALAGR